MVRGSAGSGKTVAAAQWAGSAGNGAWFVVNAETSARLPFWRAVIETLIDAGLVPENSVLRSSAESLDAISDLGRFLVRGFTQLKGNLTLVIDAYQRISDPHIHEDVVALLLGASRLRVVALTRSTGSLDSDPVQIALAPTIIDAQELLFTAEETLEVVKRSGLPEAQKVATTLWKSLDGLPVAVRAAVVSLKQDEEADVSSSVKRSLAHVIERVQRDTLFTDTAASIDIDFAMRCSIANALTVDLARELGDREDAEELLTRAESLGMGLWSQSSDKMLFSFSPVIRAALRDELMRRSPEEAPRLHRTAAQWAFDNERWPAALRHAVASGDLRFASYVVLQDWLNLVTFHGDLLASLLEELPRDVLPRRPLLAMALALHYNMTGTNRDAMGKLFVAAVASARSLAACAATKGERAVLLCIEGAGLRIAGRFDEAVAPSDKFMTVFDELTKVELHDLRRAIPTMLAQTGLNFFYEGTIDKAIPLFERAISASHDMWRAGWFHGLSLAAGSYAVLGDMKRASELVHIARRQQWPEGWKDAYIGSFYHVAEAFLAIEAGDLTTAQAHVDAMAPHLLTVEHWPIFLRAQALIDLGDGCALAGAARVKAAMAPGARPPMSPYSEIRLHASRALLLLAAGRGDDAEAALSTYPTDVPIVGICLARIRLARGEPVQALAALDSVYEETSPERMTGEILILRVLAELQRGHESKAADRLFEAFAVMRATGLRTPFTLQPAADRAAVIAFARRVRLSSHDEKLLHELMELPSIWPDPKAPVELTERERVVLQHLARLKSTTEIADALFVSVNTVKSQLRSVYRKLEVSSRDDALAVAGEQGLIGTMSVLD